MHHGTGGVEADSPPRPSFLITSSLLLVLLSVRGKGLEPVELLDERRGGLLSGVSRLSDAAGSTVLALLDLAGLVGVDDLGPDLAARFHLDPVLANSRARWRAIHPPVDSQDVLACDRVRNPTTPSNALCRRTDLRRSDS